MLVSLYSIIAHVAVLLELAYPMVGLKIVDLLAKHQCPYVFAEKLDHVEGIHEAWAVSRESVPDSARVLPLPMGPLLTHRSTMPCPTR